MTSSRFYLPQLDGLRFLAFLSVFLAHGMWGTPRPWLARLQPVGNFGVDLFFVLSSYLLTTLLLREQATTGRIHVAAFWIRRGLRIWPLYAAVVLGMAVATSLSGWYLLGLATFTFNWQLTVSFTGTPALLTGMTLLWSLSVEEQFYGLWPLCLRGATWHRVLGLALGMALIALGARAAVVLMGWGWEALIYSSLTRLDGLGIGAALAACDRPARLPAWSGPTALLAAPLAIVALQVLAPMGSQQPGPIEVLRGLLVASLLGGLVWIVVHARRGFLASAPLVYLGRISYGLYVFHGFMYTLTHTWSLRWPSRLAVAFALTLTAAALSYQLLERPFLALKGRFSYVRSAPI